MRDGATLLFEPPWPSDLCEGPELWLAETGDPARDSGQVFFCEDDDSYEVAGRVYHATMGVLLDALPYPNAEIWQTLGAPVRLHIPWGGELPFFDEDAARRGQSLLFVGSPHRFELICYTEATLLPRIGPKREATGFEETHKLTGLLRRGVYGSQSRRWDAGTTFLRCDTALCRMHLPRRLLGWEVFVKIGDAQEGEPLVYKAGQRGWRAQ